MKFKDFSEANLRDIPEIGQHDFKLLWHSDYYDGPRSGLLVYRGQKCWFENLPNNGEGQEDFFAPFVLIIELTAAQLATEEYWHELFRQKVGWHTDYYAEGRVNFELHPRDRWSEFYEAYQKDYTRLDLTENEIIGWFRW